MINLSAQYCQNTYNFAKKPGFTAMRSPDTYDTDYMYSNSHNGKAPDKKIIETITKRFPDPANITIYDIGAGDGRNSIPLLEKGYKMISSELSKEGREKIKLRTPKKKQNKIQVADKNIVKTAFQKKGNAFIMSHISQHFNKDELNSVFSNVSKTLKNKGIFMFDALVDFSGKPFVNTKVDEHGGTCRFTKAQIINAAIKSGFNLVENVPYNEKGKSRPKYINLRRWGGKGIGPSDKQTNKKRPVKLEWFVFEKA